MHLTAHDKGIAMQSSLQSKTWLIMKLTIFLLIAACTQLHANVDAQGISLSEKNASLQKVFKEIEKQSGYQFFYNEKLLSLAKGVTIQVQNASLHETLEQCFKNQPLSYEIIEKIIVVKQKESDNRALSLPIIVTGKVINKKGEVVEGATVAVKNSGNITATNERGEFSISEVDANAELVISSIGYETQEVKLHGRTFVTISLEQKRNDLNSVVIIPYGTTTKRLNTGNVFTVKGEDIQRQPLTDPILALEGRVPGLLISSGSGIPGSSYVVNLRGLNSISNRNDPFYIVDGIPFTSVSLTNTVFGGGAPGFISPFNSLNPSDIESVVVLKDADATAIYGSRGANGVILITTKKGVAGKTKFDINFYSGTGKIEHRLKLLNTQQYLQMRHEAFSNDNILPGPTDYDINGMWDTTRYTDWQKVLIGGTAHLTNLQLSVSGGSANTKFLISGGYSKQTTVFPGDFSDQKGAAHFNIDHLSSNHKLHITASASYVIDNSNLPTSDLTANIVLAPDSPPLYDSVGNLNWQGDTWTNPFGILRQNARAITNNLISSLNISYQILPGLQIKGNVGYNNIQMAQSIISPSSSYSPSYSIYPTIRTNYFANTDIKTWIAEPQISYNASIKQSKIEILVGGTFQENRKNSISQGAAGFPSDALIENITAATITQIVGFSNIDYRYNALFGRINYNLKEKYLINITGRKDGSSRFGPGNQFGNFGAVGIGWIFSNEHFVKKKTLLSYGKLRASYGSTGNDQLTDYQYLSSYSTNPQSYLGITGLYPTRISNPYFGWELVKKFEAGLELGFYNDKVLLNISYYRNRTGNQLVGYSLPAITGFTSVQANLPAIIQNTGFEFELNTFNIRARNFEWKSFINFSFPRNKLISYPNLASSSYANTYVEGKSLYVHKLFHLTGVDPQTGLYTFETKSSSGDPVYPDDISGLKETSTKFFGGFENTFSFKGFEVDVHFQFVSQTSYNYISTFSVPGVFNYRIANQPTIVLSRWQKPGDKNSIQKFTASFSSAAANAYSNARFSDFQIDGVSFFQLKNLSLSYQIPANWKNKIHLQNARIYLQCENLFSISKYVGLYPGSSSLVMPPLRIITTGIQVTL